MPRRLLILLSALAGLSLSACDNPAAGILSTAKTGDCYTVTGKDAMGQPKLIKADCPAGVPSGDSTLPPQTEQAAASAPARAPVCQAAAPVCAGPAAAHAARSHWRRASRRIHRYGHVVTEVYDEYVPASGEVSLATGRVEASPPSGRRYAHADSGLAESYQRHEEQAYAAPPPVVIATAPVQREYETRVYEGGSSSSYASASSGYYEGQERMIRSAPPVQTRRPCNCRPRPRYEPDGYLTWPGKAAY